MSMSGFKDRQRANVHARMERYRQENPEEAARIDALFDPIRDEVDRMQARLEDLTNEMDSKDSEKGIDSREPNG